MPEPEDTSDSSASPQSGGTPLTPPPTPPPAGDGPARQGSIRWQDASTSPAWQPTVAEARHRDKTRKAREAAQRLAEEQERQEQQRAASRRKVLMGSVAAVGLVGAVALGYHLLNDNEEVSATCVKDGTNEVVADSYCSTGHAGSGGIFIYAGSPYRYYYGGSNGGVGSVAKGGTLELPRGTTGKTTSGSSISRGGFGSSSHGSSGS